MNDIRIGNGYDVHALGPGLPLMLGGVRVESPVGCIAHSDGDVAIHALCDALLGALALGDIGKHFPDTSDEFKGIDSKILLQRTMSLVKEKGYGVCNVDITKGYDHRETRLRGTRGRLRSLRSGSAGRKISALAISYGLDSSIFLSVPQIWHLIAPQDSGKRINRCNFSRFEPESQADNRIMFFSLTLTMTTQDF